MDPTDFQNVAIPTTPPTSLEEWGIMMEQIAQDALKHRTQVPGLPNKLSRAYKGRCRPPKLIQSPVLAPVKPGWHGAYEPTKEVTTLASRRQVKQLRRMVAIHFRLLKQEKSANPPADLITEWRTILKDTSFAPSFLNWIQDALDMNFPAYPLPSAAWMHSAIQFVKHMVDAQLHDDQQFRIKRFAYQRHLDKQQGHKTAYARVRGIGKPPVNDIVQHVTIEGIIASCDPPGTFEFYADTRELEQLSQQFPVHVEGHTTPNMPSWRCTSTT